MKAWFCYERDFADRPVPVIYYDELPSTSAGGKENIRKRSQIVEISHLPKGPDGEYSFAELLHLYPLLKSNGDNGIVNDKEKNMSRPVSGFLTSQGQFFETQQEADFYDATYELNRAATRAVAEHGGFDAEQADSIAEGIKAFIGDNEKVIREYLNARAALTTDGSASHVQVDGSTAEDNPTDDPSIRSSSDTQLDEEAPTEALPERARKKSSS